MIHSNNFVFILQTNRFVSTKNSFKTIKFLFSRKRSTVNFITYNPCKCITYSFNYIFNQINCNLYTIYIKIQS